MSKERVIEKKDDEQAPGPGDVAEVETNNDEDNEADAETTADDIVPSTSTAAEKSNDDPLDEPKPFSEKAGSSSSRNEEEQQDDTPSTASKQKEIDNEGEEDSKMATTTATTPDPANEVDKEEEESPPESSVAKEATVADDGEDDSQEEQAGGIEEGQPDKKKNFFSPYKKKKAPIKQVSDQDEKEVKNEDDNKQGDSNTASKEPVVLVAARPVKRARTAYFLFADDKRPHVVKEHPGEGVATIARALGQLWSALSPDEKQVYQERAAAERARVAQEMEAWKMAGGVLEVGGGADGGGGGTKRDASGLVFPMAKVRKICKLDPDVRALSKEAMILIAKASELATAKLGKESVKVAQLQNRRKLLPEDVAQVCQHREQFLFLKEDIKDLVKGQKQQQNAAGLGAAVKEKVSAGETARQQAAAGSKPLTSYFGGAAAATATSK